MTTIHLSDTDMQKYALQNMDCDAAIVAHMQQCSTCRKKAMEYQKLFEAIKLQEIAEFDFNLSEAVGQAIKRKPHFSFLTLSIYLLTLLGIALFAIVFYPFVLPGVDMFANPFIAITCLTTITVVIIHNTGLYKNHRKAMDVLNAY